MSPDAGFSINDVVSGDCCIGCGACGVAAPSLANVSLTQTGLYSASLSGPVGPAVSAVCPFSDDAANEDWISREFLGELSHRSGRLGQYDSIHAGRVTDDSFRVGSSSGGLVSWVAMELLRRGHVDGVVHVKKRAESSSNAPLFEYGLSFSEKELLGNRKSVYYPVEFSKVLAGVKASEKRFVFIGIPCHIKALRLLQLQDDSLRRNVKYTIGLVCGHMKATGFAESFAWQVGVEPANLLNVDFRVKDINAPANRYRFAATARSDGKVRESPASELVGANWGHGFFQPNACNYCDDIFAETADVCFGDAWIPRFQDDPLGHNVVVVRSRLVAELLNEGVNEGAIKLEDLTEDEAASSQAGNFRHRRDGLAVRLADDDAAGRKRPEKRTLPTYDRVDSERIEVVRLRQRLSAASLEGFIEAKRHGDLSLFFKWMNGLVVSYDALTARTLRSSLLARVPIEHRGKVRRLVAVVGRVRRMVARE